MLQVVNQRPSLLVPDWSDDITVDFGPTQIIDTLMSILEPIWTPLLPNMGPAKILDDTGNVVTENHILSTFMECCKETVNPDAEDFCRELFTKTLAAYDKGLPAEAVFVAQDNAVAKCPIPSGNVLYVVDDLKDACRQFLAAPVAKAPFLRCTEAFVLPERHIAVHFTARPVFDAYKTFVRSFAQAHAANMDPDDVKKFQDFDTITLDVLEGIILRASDTNGQSAYSFQRILMKATLDWLKTTQDAGLCVPYLTELLNPRSILFIDVEQVARCPRAKLDKLVNDIRSVMRQKVTPVSLKTIAGMTALSAQKRKIQSQLQNAMTAATGGPAGRRAIFRFRSSAPGPALLSRRIVALVKKQANVANSENYAKTVKLSYQRQNRRDPDNMNLKGKSIGMTYKPDIHIYLDTSGSISEENYKSAIMTCIFLARKLDINLYFNSFSHILSDCVKLRTRGVSAMGAYQEFQRIPKVNGGTNFRNIWDYIMESPRRRKELSLIITDLEYSPPADRVVHPDKLWYVPIDVSPSGWNMMVRSADAFCRAMYNIDGNIRKKILM